MLAYAIFMLFFLNVSMKLHAIYTVPLSTVLSPVGFTNVISEIFLSCFLVMCHSFEFHFECF